MKKTRLIVTMIIVIAALLVPMAVSASGSFYCTALENTTGDGSFDDPWDCTTDEELKTVINDFVCATYGGGSLYRINDGFYDFYKIEVGSGEVCEVTQQIRYQGYPPDTGPELNMALIVGGVILAGGAFLVAGLVMRRKQLAKA